MNYNELTSQEKLNLTTEQNKFITKVYGWMAFALIITGLVALYTATSQTLLQFIFGNRFVFFGLIIGEFILVATLSGAINKLTSKQSIAVFILYSAVNGLTLASIFLMYTYTTISTAFFITAGMFLVMTFYGYVTEKDLTSFGSLAYMLLIGIIIGTVVNIFLNSESLYYIITYVGVAIFIGLIAYDTQKIKKIFYSVHTNQEAKSKASIIGALALYLDFVNLFLFIIRFIGGKRK